MAPDATADMAVVAMVATAVKEEEEVAVDTADAVVTVTAAMAVDAVAVDMEAADVVAVDTVVDAVATTAMMIEIKSR
jgi:hypothetical protein